MEGTQNPRKDRDMNMQMVFHPLIVLMIFFLALLWRWDKVRRPLFFMWGCVAIALGILLLGLLEPLSTRRWANILWHVSGTVFAVFAFACAILTCFGASLPGKIPGVDEETEVKKENPDELEFDEDQEDQATSS